MRVLIVGGGGREHTLAWKAAHSPMVSHVYVAPGNAGTSLEPKTTNVKIGAEEIDGLVSFARETKIDLVIVGPEAPLTLGIADRFGQLGIPCFGPSAAAARLEGSKEFTKNFLKRHNIPTADFEVFDDASAACDYIDRMGAPIVVKADGLAAGKGVVVAETVDQAKQAVVEMLVRNRFGAAGSRVVIEQCLVGEELSYICMVHGTDMYPLATSQDHKAAFDGDKGPNTGGMGAYSPAPIYDDILSWKIMERIISPTVHEMLYEGNPYMGFLYAGLMIDAEGNPHVLEFNCRLGDPEAQPMMMRLKPDLIDLIDAVHAGDTLRAPLKWDRRTALGVVVASEGYPGTYPQGQRITGLDAVDSDDVKVFHAGTSFDAEGNLIASGGRVLCVTALGSTVSDAQSRAYEAVSKISMDNMHYRTDIGNKAIDHLTGG